ncbi:M28 family peptidase [bacterium]|nr:M28 family peptidase [bacterium]
MNIKETFLKLTSRTYPNKTEYELFHLLPSDLKNDDYGNKFYVIGENPSVMFTSHLDTATAANTPVNHVFEGDIIKTDGKSILGADDKAGVTIMLYMMSKGVKGLYYFFLGEEVGCLGSKWLSEVHAKDPNPYIKKVVSFDRRGTDSVITFQSSSRCCSDAFGSALSKELNEKAKTLGIDFSYKNDPTGVYTDSAKFVKIYPECTNISVGYKSEHTFMETQNIDHLEKLAQTVVLVDWENLPVERDPSKVEYSNYYGKYKGYYSGWDNFDNEYYYDEFGYGYTYSRGYKPKLDKHWFMDDDEDNFLSYVELNKDGEVVGVSFSQERIEFELECIQDLFDDLGVAYKSIEWNGIDLSITYPEHLVDEYKFLNKVRREELSQYIPELNFWVDSIEEEKKGKTYNEFRSDLENWH